MAIASSPTFSASESPSAMTWKGPGASILSTAMSERTSRPTTVAEKSRPSDRVILIAGSCAPRVTTWALVITCPSSLIMTPEPLPAPVEPATSMVTTEGSADAATAVISLASNGELTVMAAGEETPGVTRPLAERFQIAKAPPAVPPRSPPTISATVTKTPSVRARRLSSSRCLRRSRE